MLSSEIRLLTIKNNQDSVCSIRNLVFCTFIQNVNVVVGNPVMPRKSRWEFCCDIKKSGSLQFTEECVCCRREFLCGQRHQMFF